MHVDKLLITDRDGYHFNMVGHESEVSIDCEPGFVSHLGTKGIAEGCGIGKMLMNLFRHAKQV